MRAFNLVMGCELLEGRQLLSATSPPTVMFEQYVKGSGTSRTFAVYYDGVDAIDKRTLDSNDIWVFGGNDFGARAVFVASAKTKRGNGLIARYRIDGILGGNYSVEMGEGEVRDIFGAMVNPGTIGAFRWGARAGRWWWIRRGSSIRSWTWAPGRPMGLDFHRRRSIRRLAR